MHDEQRGMREFWCCLSLSVCSWAYHSFDCKVGIIFPPCRVLLRNDSMEVLSMELETRMGLAENEDTSLTSITKHTHVRIITLPEGMCQNCFIGTPEQEQTERNTAGGLGS